MIDESQKLLSGEKTPAEFLRSLELYFPLLGSLVSTPQDPRWHAEGNVRIHTEMVLAELIADINSERNSFTEDEVTALLFGAALHDIGKALTTKKKLIDGVVRIVSPRHAEVGMSYCAPCLASLPELPPKISEWILGIVGYHHHPRKLLSSNGSAGSYFRIARSVPCHLIWTFEKADLRGRTCEDLNGQLEILELFKLEAENLNVWKRAPYENWEQRIEGDFGITDSEEASYVIDAAKYRLENGAINSLEEAIGKTYAARSNHGRLILMCGPSGSGKSEWVAQYAKTESARVVSLDRLREEISGKRSRQADNGKVMQAAKELLREGLRKKETTIWDATSLRSDGRRALVSLAHDYHAATEIVRFAVAPKEIRRRNRKRENKIPESIIERQLDRFEWPHLWEAHRVTTVRS